MCWRKTYETSNVQILQYFDSAAKHDVKIVPALAHPSHYVLNVIGVMCWHRNIKDPDPKDLI